MKTSDVKKIVAAVCVVFALSSVCFAQSSTATLTISGKVDPVNTITIASQAGYNALDLVNGASGKVVGIATETSNSKLGYNVTLTSANAGISSQAFLKGSTGNSDTVNYSITYGGSTVTLASGSAVVTTATSRTGSTGATKDIAVTFAGGWLAADTYSDTITLSIASN